MVGGGHWSIFSSVMEAQEAPNAPKTCWFCCCSSSLCLIVTELTWGLAAQISTRKLWASAGGASRGCAACFCSPAGTSSLRPRLGYQEFTGIFCPGHPAVLWNCKHVSYHLLFMNVLMIMWPVARMGMIWCSPAFNKDHVWLLKCNYCRVLNWNELKVLSQVYILKPARYRSIFVHESHSDEDKL